MADDNRIQDTVSGLLDSPGGIIIQDIGKYLRAKMKLIILIFIISMIFAFSLTKSIIKWLIAPSRLPDNVNIIVTSPIEFILLQLQIAVSFGVIIIGLFLLLAGVRNGIKHSAVRQRFSELNLKPPRLSSTILATIIAIFSLGLVGLLYSWELLTPMILDYLTNDAQKAGLTTEWRLSAYVGFISNLALACTIGFQAPVVTLLLLKLEIVTRSQISQYRRQIWFTAFILGAFLSPPDPLSLFMVAMPVVILFEIAMLIDRAIGN